MPEALQLAREADLDLVEIAPTANPPVCKILNYGKFRYELAQKDKESRKKTVNVSVKEMKYRPKIGGGDFDTKTRKVGEFLSEGHKVKVTIMFRGREMSHPELGMQILDRIRDTIGAAAKVEATPRIDGRNMTMVLAPERKGPAPKEPKPGEAPPRPASPTPQPSPAPVAEAIAEPVPSVD